MSRVVKRMLSVEYASAVARGRRARFRAPRTIQVRSSLLDERHPLPKQVFEGAGRGETVNERNRVRRRRSSGETAARSLVLITHTLSLPSH